jgi:hypothetical protein
MLDCIKEMRKKHLYTQDFKDQLDDVVPARTDAQIAMRRAQAPAPQPVPDPAPKRKKFANVATEPPPDAVEPAPAPAKKPRRKAGERENIKLFEIDKWVSAYQKADASEKNKVKADAKEALKAVRGWTGFMKRLKDLGPAPAPPKHKKHHSHHDDDNLNKEDVAEVVKDVIEDAQKQKEELESDGLPMPEETPRRGRLEERRARTERWYNRWDPSDGSDSDFDGYSYSYDDEDLGPPDPPDPPRRRTTTEQATGDDTPTTKEEGTQAGTGLKDVAKAVGGRWAKLLTRGMDIYDSLKVFHEKDKIRIPNFARGTWAEPLLGIAKRCHGEKNRATD